MLTLKQKTIGFTLIELLVVIAIMALMATILIINYNGTRDSRDVKISQSQLVTNIRKTQSYILSARNTGTGTNAAAKYYIIKLTSGSGQYQIQSLNTSYALNAALETLAMPAGVAVSGLQVTPACTTSCSPFASAWVQAAYSAPYGKLYMFTTQDINSSSCPGINDIVAAAQNPGCMLSLADRKLVVTLRGKSASNTATVFGVSGKVTAP